MANPSHVRLRKALQNSMIADVAGGSGWSISGLDVKPYPKDGPARAFVRTKVAAGVLVEATAGDYDAVQKVHAVSPPGAEKPAEETPPTLIQEAFIQEDAKKQREKLLKGTSSQSDQGEEEEEETEGEEISTEMSLARLKEEASARGLSTSGSKAELVERIEEYEEENA